MQKEIWLPIKGFENRYLISNRGRVMSLGRVMIAKDGHLRIYKNKILKLTPHKNLGYVSVRLYYEDGKTYEHISVHRLVATHFIPNPNDLPVVNHIDTVRDNNDVGNLEWVTVQENLTHHNCHTKGGLKRRKRVFQYTDNGNFLRAFNSVKDAHEAGYNKNMVRKVCLGIRKRYKGYKWSYK